MKMRPSAGKGAGPARWAVVRRAVRVRLRRTDRPEIADADDVIAAAHLEVGMAKYGKTAQNKVRRAMHERKRGKLKSGRSGKRVTSRKQAIAIGLSEARRSGGKVPRKRGGSRKRKSGRSRAGTRKK
jgi:uncharacterized protein DUF6496